jgi:hypothetical protein
MKNMVVYRGKVERERPIPDAFLPDRIVEMTVQYIEDEVLPYRTVSAVYDNCVAIDQIYYGDDEVGFEDQEVGFRAAGDPGEYEGNESGREIAPGLTVAAFCALGKGLVEEIIAEEMAT